MSALPLPKPREEEKPAGVSLAASMQGMLDGLKNLPQTFANFKTQFQAIDLSKLAEQIKESLGGLGSVFSGKLEVASNNLAAAQPAASRPAATTPPAVQDDHLKPTEVAAAQPDNKTSLFAANAASMTTPEVAAAQPAPANNLNLQVAPS